MSLILDGPGTECNLIIGKNNTRTLDPFEILIEMTFYEEYKNKTSSLYHATSNWIIGTVSM